VVDGWGLGSGRFWALSVQLQNGWGQEERVRRVSWIEAVASVDGSAVDGMKSIRGFFAVGEKRRRTVAEVADGIVIALYQEEHFEEDLNRVLQKMHKRYGEPRRLLLVDVQPEPWMVEVLPERFQCSPCHLGPYSYLPSLKAVFEVAANMYDWLRYGLENQQQNLVLVVSSASYQDSRPMMAISMVVACYFLYTHLHDPTFDAIDTFYKTVKKASIVSEQQLRSETSGPNLRQYVQNFASACRSGGMPNRQPIDLLKIIIHGKVTLPGPQAWKPVVKLYCVAEDDDNDALDRGAVIASTHTSEVGGSAIFDIKRVIYGDFWLSFEHRIVEAETTMPLFTIARNTGFMEPTFMRIQGRDELEFPAGQSIGLEFSDEFTVDIIFDEARDMIYEMEKDSSEKYSEDTFSLVEKVHQEFEAIQEIVQYAPGEPPKLISATKKPPPTVNTVPNLPAPQYHKQLRDELEEAFVLRGLKQARPSEGTTQSRAQLISELLNVMLASDMSMEELEDFIYAFQDYQTAAKRSSKAQSHQEIRDLLVDHVDEETDTDGEFSSDEFAPIDDDELTLDCDDTAQDKELAGSSEELSKAYETLNKIVQLVRPSATYPSVPIPQVASKLAEIQLDEPKIEARLRETIDSLLLDAKKGNLGKCVTKHDVIQRFQKLKKDEEGKAAGLPIPPLPGMSYSIQRHATPYLTKST